MEHDGRGGTKRREINSDFGLPTETSSPVSVKPKAEPGPPMPWWSDSHLNILQYLNLIGCKWGSTPQCQHHFWTPKSQSHGNQRVSTCSRVLLFSRLMIWARPSFRTDKGIVFRLRRSSSALLCFVPFITNTVTDSNSPNIKLYSSTFKITKIVITIALKQYRPKKCNWLLYFSLLYTFWLVISIWQIASHHIHTTWYWNNYDAYIISHLQIHANSWVSSFPLSSQGITGWAVMLRYWLLNERRYHYEGSRPWS